MSAVRIYQPPEQRRRERAWQLNAAIAGSPQVLTLSYAIRGVTDGREAGPAPVLLNALRTWQGNPDLSYADLHTRLGAPRSPVPHETEVAIDARDAWFGAMSDGPLLLDATHALRSTFGGLDRGLAAAEARLNVEASAFHGLVPDAGVLDPRVTGVPISPSSLERLAHCGLRWFYTVALDARVPDEPVFDALFWLNALDRGLALHRIYELVIRPSRSRADGECCTRPDGSNDCGNGGTGNGRNCARAFGISSHARGGSTGGRCRAVRHDRARSVSEGAVGNRRT